MSDNLTPVDTAPAAIQEPAAPSAAAQTAPRMRLPIAAVIVYWVLNVVVGWIEKPYFIGFLYIMASVALLTLVLLGWWVLNRRIPWTERLLGILLVFGAGAAVEPLCHPTIGGYIGLSLTGLPLALTAGVLWMYVVGRMPSVWRRVGGVVVVLLAWGYFTLIRMNGFDAALQADTHWRWTPSAEERFLQKHAAETQTNSSPTTDAKWKPTIGPDDWTGYRGPQRDGVLRGVRIATDWKTNPPQPRWRRLVGPAWSSMIVLGDRLFTQEQRGQQECVVCYDAGTGDELWSHEDATRFWDHQSGAGPRATPTYAEGRLYTMGGTGRLNCLDAATGRAVWTQDITADSGAKPPMWGYSSSPLVTQGMVIVYAGGDGDKGILAYRADSGKLVWGQPAGNSSYSSPQLTTLAGKPQILMLHDRGLSALAPATGAVLWKSGKEMPGAPRTIQPHALSPTALLVGTLEGQGVARLEVTQNSGQWKVEEPWNSSQLKPEFPDLVIHNGHAYGFDVSMFCCIDVSTGERCWKEGRYGRGQVILLPEQSLLVVISDTGQVVLLAADPDSHRELGRFQAINGKTWNHPVIAGGRLYARNAEEMACYDLPAMPTEPLP